VGQNVAQALQKHLGYKGEVRAYTAGREAYEKLVAAIRAKAARLKWKPNKSSTP
jgi:hypothetical protein